jgi:hypothetical protein
VFGDALLFPSIGERVNVSPGQTKSLSRQRLRAKQVKRSVMVNSNRSSANTEDTQ